MDNLPSKPVCTFCKGTHPEVPVFFTVGKNAQGKELPFCLCAPCIRMIHGMTIEERLFFANLVIFVPSVDTLNYWKHTGGGF